MARKFVPRHIAKQIEAEKPVPKKSRFNQRRFADGNYMLPLNPTILKDEVRYPNALHFNLMEVTRTIRETATNVTIDMEFTVSTRTTTDALNDFVEKCTNSIRNHSGYGPNFEAAYEYEGTLYEVTSIELSDPMPGDFGDRNVVFKAHALPEIIKLKRNNSHV
jgi:hypothetical protein